MTKIIDPEKYGVSFSIKQCRDFQIDPTDTLSWLLAHGFRRFRLMSYWDEHERSQGDHILASLDKQIKLIASYGGVVSLCLGVRQPRWPENHWPNWAWSLPKPERDNALLKYIETVVLRYKDEPAIISYQLENEALLSSFGVRPDTDRKRLSAEYKLVKGVDPSRPIVMSTSTSWGIPLRKPRPDIVGFSFYQVVFNKGRYSKSFHKPWIDRLRAKLIRLFWRKPSFIHELQCEPWGPKNIWDMDKKEQDKSMSLAQIGKNISLAKSTNLYPIDLWGCEWWYWSHLNGDDIIWQTVQKLIND